MLRHWPGLLVMFFSLFFPGLVLKGLLSFGVADGLSDQKITPRKYYCRPDLCLKVFPSSVWVIPVALRNYLFDQSTAKSSTKPPKAKQERVLHYPSVLIYRALANKQVFKMHVLDFTAWISLCDIINKCPQSDIILGIK